jgi:aryl-alcohol dehydrogenase-like predicted oxidoreductase
MKKEKLGNTDLYCSRLALGTWGLGGPNDIDRISVGWKTLDRNQAKRTILTALEYGLNMIDTSDFYGLGLAEELIGEVVPKSNEVIIATKGGLIPKFEEGTQTVQRNFSAEHLRRSVDNSLKRLRRDTIDIYQLHGPNLTLLHDETWETLESLRSSGKLRYVGISLKSTKQMTHEELRLLDRPTISSVQLKHNLLDSKAVSFIETSACRRYALLARSPLAHGFLTAKYSAPEDFSENDHRRRKFKRGLNEQLTTFLSEVNATLGCNFESVTDLALQFVVANPIISVTIFGATSPSQVQNTLKAINTAQLISSQEANFIATLAKRYFS